MSAKVHPDYSEETEAQHSVESDVSDNVIEPVELRPFNDEELAWVRIMLAHADTVAAAASEFLKAFPEIVEIEHKDGSIEIATKEAVKARLVLKFENLKYMPNRRSSREIEENKKVIDRIKEFNEKYDRPFIRFNETIYYAELVEMMETAESAKERFKYLKEMWRVYGSGDSKQDLNILGYSPGDVEVVGEDE